MDVFQLFRAKNSFLSGAIAVLVITVFLAPLVFLPTTAAPFQLTKTSLLFFGVFLSLVLALLGWLKEGSITFPKSMLLGVVWILPLAYLLSAFLSGGDPMQSLVGRQFESDTFLFMLASALLATLAALLLKDRIHAFLIPSAVLISFLCIGLFGLVRLLGGTEVLSFGVFTDATSNVVGKWNDLGIISGLTALITLAWLEILRPRGTFKIGLWVLLALSLFFMVLVSFFPVLLLFSIVALGFFMASVFRNLMGSHEGHHGGGRGMKAVSGLALFAVLVGVFTIVGNVWYGNSLANSFGISFLEVRPSWQTTIEVGKGTFADNFLFGSGPNTFTGQWLKYKTSDINITPFWSVDFPAGIGVVPTAFATTGLVGILAWLMLLGWFCYAGVRSLVRLTSEDTLTYFVTLSSFIAAAYLWALSIVYVPNAILIAFAFLFTGLFIASLRHFPSLQEEREIVFARNPRVGFVAVFLSTLVLLLACGGLYLTGQKYVAWYLFQNAALAINQEGGVMQSEGYLTRALALSEVDQFYAARANINLTKMQDVVAAETGDPAELREVFESALAGAIRDAQEATRLGSTNYQNWLVLGNIYRAVVPLGIEGAYDNAKSAYDRALVLAPRNPFIPFTLAQLEIARGDLTKAATHVDEALTLKANYLDAIFLSAQLALNRGETQNAIRAVEAAALFEPQNPVILYQLGILYFGNNEIQKSIPALEEAIRLNDTYANARYFLGLAYYRQGNMVGALEQFKRIQDTNPDNEEVAQIIANLEEGVPLEQLGQNPVRTRPEQPVEESI